jgi:tetratricopeptide (TPR) repeat protein
VTDNAAFSFLESLLLNFLRMNKKVFWLSIIAIMVSFAGGFLLANALNRKELDNLRSEIGRLKNTPQTPEKENSDQTLSAEEIRQKIAEADKNPENIEFQKGLAMALYQYASMKQEPQWLPDVGRLLNRVHEKNPKDFNTIISLGNLYLDIAQNNADSDDLEAKGQNNKNIGKSREFYQKALEIKPNETDVQTDLGITYLLENPPQNDKAIAEFQKSLKSNPKDERALENIIRAFINAGKTKEAEEFLSKLRQLNPNYESLNELDTKLTEKKNSK